MAEEVLRIRNSQGLQGTDMQTPARYELGAGILQYDQGLRRSLRRSIERLRAQGPFAPRCQAHLVGGRHFRQPFANDPNLLPTASLGAAHLRAQRFRKLRIRLRQSIGKFNTGKRPRVHSSNAGRQRQFGHSPFDLQEE